MHAMGTKEQIVLYVVRVNNLNTKGDTVDLEEAL